MRPVRYIGCLVQSQSHEHLHHVIAFLCSSKGSLYCARKKHQLLPLPPMHSQQGHMVPSESSLLKDESTSMRINLVKFNLQQEAEAMKPSRQNPYGNGFTIKERDLTCESEAARVCNTATGRTWKIKNPQSLHPITGKFCHGCCSRECKAASLKIYV